MVFAVTIDAMVNDMVGCPTPDATLSGKHLREGTEKPVHAYVHLLSSIVCYEPVGVSRCR